MRSSVTSNLCLVTLVAGVAGLYGCSGTEDGGGGVPTFGGSTGTAGTTSTTAGTTSTAGTPSTGGSTGTSGSGAGGSGTTAGTGGTGTTGGTGGTGTAGGATGGTGGAAPTNDITSVWKADGCGKDYTGMVGQKITIGTTGVKDANCAAKLDGVPKCGPWGQESSTWQKTPLPRDYWVYLPANYDANKAYPLVFEGPGCGGSGGGVYGLPNVKDQVIRIGISPAPKSVGHGTNPNQGCFDDKEGDDSLDWVFYENLYDKLKGELCFDRNRVFSVGDSSGSWFSNELGCKYAGDPERPVRGVLPNTGGLPNQPEYAPTCTNKPMSGMWVHEVGDTENPFSGNKYAISRAMTVNGCQGATSYDDAVTKGLIENFPIGTGAADTCKLIKGCPEIYPLVVCALPGNAHQPHNNVAEPGFATFLKLFNQGNFIKQ